MEPSESKQNILINIVNASRDAQTCRQKIQITALFVIKEIQVLGANINYTKQVAKLIIAKEFCDIE